jgi:hypothetical protein
VETGEWKVGGQVFIFDNFRAHKTAHVKDVLEQCKMCAITNVPYHPELNFCEKFIMMAKD